MGNISSPVFFAQNIRHNVPTASALPQINLSLEFGKTAGGNEDVPAVSGSLESVVSEFG